MRRMARVWMVLGCALGAASAQAGEADRGAWSLVDRPSDDTTFSEGSAAEVSASPWWETFGDPQLTAVVEAALTESPDLAGAWERVVQAEAAAGQALAPMLPQVGAEASVQYAPTQNLGFGFGIPNQFEQEIYSQGRVGVNGSLGVDVFGQRYSGWRAGRFDAQAAAGDRDAVVLSLTTRVAQAYFDLLLARESVILAREQRDASESVLELTQLRYEAAGDTSGLDVLQQRQQTEGTRVRVPQAELNEQLASQRLNLLLGRPAYAPLPEVASGVPDLPAQPALGTPAGLLDTRPDLRAAESRLDAARFRKTSATLALLPTLGVSAGAGQQFIDTNEAIWQDYWNVGASATVPLFNGGSLHHGVRQARAGERAAARSLDVALLTAIQEVESALAQERQQTAVLNATRAQLTAASDAFDNAQDRYRQGLVTYQQVLISLSALQAVQQTELTARRTLLDVRLALHQSLGGAWTTAAANASEGAR